jgi:hypothetical protein
VCPQLHGTLLRCGFKCDHIDTGNPDQNIDHGVPLHGYLDQGCNTHRTRLPRHRNKGYHLAWALLGFLYSPSIRDTNSVHDAPALTVRWGGGCQPVGFYAFGFSPVWSSAALQLFTSLPLWLRGC